MLVRCQCCHRASVRLDGEFPLPTMSANKNVCNPRYHEHTIDWSLGCCCCCSRPVLSSSETGSVLFSYKFAAEIWLAIVLITLSTESCNPSMTSSIEICLHGFSDAPEKLRYVQPKVTRSPSRVLRSTINHDASKMSSLMPLGVVLDWKASLSML